VKSLGATFWLTLASPTRLVPSKILNGALLFSFARDGHIGEASLRLSAAFGLAMVVGLFVGQKIHDRVDAKRFQVTIFAMLGAVGLVLVIRNAL
jgi:uncharacterized membrane protein YfcA